MQKVADHIKARYRRKGLLTSSSTWPPFHAQSFTSLALVHQKITQLQVKEDTTKIARVRATGDIHKIPELTSSIKLDNIHQIFIPVTSGDQAQCPMNILIEGHPGIGKATLAKQLCLQWANNQLLTSDKLVLLLMLRDPNVQKITSTEQLVRYTQSTDQVQCILSYLQDNNGLGVTLIIDGFDELSTELRQTSFFRKVIEGDVLHNVRVVVTSRPSASACLHQCVQRRIEVLGFEKSSKEQYVDNALKDTPEHLHKLKAHFQQYPNIDALCYIPLNMAIIVYLCLLGSLPSTATKMYESFIINTIYRHLKKVGKIPNNASISQIEKLPQPVCEALQQLQKVAFDGLVSDKIVFTVEELPVLCKDDPTCYGLLQSTECYSAEEVGTPTQSFNFLHLGIQEYFAAKHITTLLEDEMYTLLKESFIVTDDDPDPYSKSVRLSNMWILYCGITRGQCKTLRYYLTTYFNPYNIKQRSGYRRYRLSRQSAILVRSQRLVTQSSCINPSSTQSVHSLAPSRGKHITPYAQPHDLPTINETSTSKQVNSNIDSQVTSEKMTGPSQQGSASDQRISNTRNISQQVLKDPLKVLYLFQCFQEAQDNELCEVLSQSFDSGVIDISGNSLLPHQVVSLGFFLSRSHRKWKELNLLQCDIGDHGMSIIHQYLCGDKTNKQEITNIDLGYNNLTGASSHLIADIISHLQPHTLLLGGNNITNVRDISTAISNTSTFKALVMWKNDLETVAISDMMICLEELDITGNKFSDHGAKVISEGIINSKTLRKLYIHNNNIGPSGTTAIANALTINTSLQQLHISNNNIGPLGTTAIANTLTINTSLQQLDISNNNIGPSGTTAIANALGNNTSLRQLYMDGDKVGQDGAIAIAKAITNNKTLETLSLGDDTMDKESAMIIMRSLHCNNTITKLWLSAGLCYDDSVKGEVIKINDRRSECNVQKLELHGRI